MNTKVAVVILAILLALGGAFFAGRASKRCPQILLPIQADSLPETKPLVPDTVRLKTVLLRIDTLWQADTFWRAETLWRTAAGFKPVVFGNRWPHTGDTAIVWGKDSLTLVPFGFVPQQVPIEARIGFKHQPLLEVGGIWSWGGSDQLWATVPNLARRLDRRVIYIPERVGMSFQPAGHRWGLTVSWTVF